MSTETMPITQMSIEERNAWFQTLTPRQQRIQIAHDVLEQIKAGFILPSRMVYFQSSLPYLYTGSLQEALLQPGVTCRVCGIGALFATRVHNYDHWPEEIRNTRVLSVDADEMMDALASCFTRTQLKMIEYAFEGWDTGDGSLLAAAGAQYQQLEYATRMREIMQNIIRNDGDFLVSGFEAECREDAATLDPVATG